MSFAMRALFNLLDLVQYRFTIILGFFISTEGFISDAAIVDPPDRVNIPERIQAATELGSRPFIGGIGEDVYFLEILPGYELIRVEWVSGDVTVVESDPVEPLWITLEAAGYQREGRDPDINAGGEDDNIIHATEPPVPVSDGWLNGPRTVGLSIESSLAIYYDFFWYQYPHYAPEWPVHIISDRSLSLKNNRTVEINAEPQFEGEDFFGWISDVPGVANPSQASTTFTVPSNETILSTAFYRGTDISSQYINVTPIYSGISPENLVREAPIIQGNISDIAIDVHGNRFVCGTFRDYEDNENDTGFDFDPTSGSDFKPNAGRSAYPSDKRGFNFGFVTKYNSDGSYAWTQIVAGDSTQNCASIEVDSGTVFVAGTFSGKSVGIGGFGSINKRQGSAAFVLALDSFTGAPKTSFGEQGVQILGSAAPPQPGNTPGGAAYAYDLTVQNGTIYAVGTFAGSHPVIGFKTKVALLPPAEPAVGDEFVIDERASLIWDGEEGNIATRAGNGWRFTKPITTRGADGFVMALEAATGAPRSSFGLDYNRDGNGDGFQLFGGSYESFGGPIENDFSGHDSANSIEVLGGVLYIGGTLASSTVFINGDTVLSTGSMGLQDAYVLALSADSGMPVSEFGSGGITVFGGSGYDKGRDVSIGDKVVYLGGDLGSNNFGFGSLNQPTDDVFVNELNDAFVIALDAENGAPLGDFGRGGYQFVASRGVDIAHHVRAVGDTVYLAGEVAGNTAIGRTPDFFSNDGAPGIGGSDAFIVALDAATGVPRSAFSDDGLELIGGSGRDSGLAVEVIADDVYIGGNVSVLHNDVGIGNAGIIDPSGFGGFMLRLNGVHRSSSGPQDRDTSRIRVAAGESHNLFINHDGRLWAWGDNGQGQIGDGTQKDSSAPILIDEVATWKEVDANADRSIAVKDDGSLWQWGEDAGKVPTQVGTDTDWTMIAVGISHFLGLKSDGSLWSWGSNDEGQLGDGTTEDRTTPEQVGTSTDWAQISAGHYHSLALRSDGTVWAWGDNYSGQAVGFDPRVLVPHQRDEEGPFTSVRAGLNYSFAVKDDRSLWAWGTNLAGELGNGFTSFGGQYEAVQVLKGSQVWGGQISGGWAHSAGIQLDGSLWTWGASANGRLGLGDSAAKNETSPKLVSRDRWITVSAGDSHTVAVQEDGTVWAWGRNQAGQLGDGTEADQNVPLRIHGDSRTPSEVQTPVAFLVNFDIETSSLPEPRWGGKWNTIRDPDTPQTQVFARDGSSLDGISVHLSSWLPIGEVESPWLASDRYWVDQDSTKSGFRSTSSTALITISGLDPTLRHEAGLVSVSRTDQGEAQFSIFGDTGDSNPDGASFSSYRDGYQRGLVLAWNKIIPNSEGEITIAANRIEGELRIQAMWISSVSDPTPFIVRAPASQIVNLGQSAQMEISAVGQGNLRYQWLLDGKPIEGAHESSLHIESVSLRDSGGYAVEVINDNGSVTSSPASLTIGPSLFLNFGGNSGSAAPLPDRPGVWNHLPSPTGTYLELVNRNGRPAVGVQIHPVGWTQPIPSQSPWIAGDKQWVDANATSSGWLSTGSQTSIRVAGLTSSLAYRVEVVAATSSDNGITRYSIFDRFADSIPNGSQFSSRIDGFQRAHILSWNAIQPNESGEIVLSAKSESGNISVQAMTLYALNTTAPQIVLQPTSPPLKPGDRLSLNVQSLGLEPLSYQWRKDGIDITGADEPGFTIESVQLSDAGAYTVIVRNESGSITSSPATLTIDDPALMEDTRVVRQLPVNFSPGTLFPVSINLKPALETSAYAVEDQPPAGWLVSNINEEGSFDVKNGKVKWGPFFDNIERIFTYDITPALTASGSARFTGDAALDGVKHFVDGSEKVTLREIVPPPNVEEVAARQLPVDYSPGSPLPVSISVRPFEDAHVYAVEDQPPAGWLVSNINEQGSFDERNGKVKWGPFFDNNERNLTYEITPDATSEETGRFAGVVALDGVDYVVSGSDELPLRAIVSPIITLQPASQEVTERDLVSFVVIAVGTEPLKYQWRKAEVDIAGAIESEFTIENVQLSDAGNYSVIVSNESGSVTSNDAVLTVNIRQTQISVTPSPLAFGEIIVGETVSKPLTVLNIGEADLTIVSITSDLGDLLKISATALSISPQSGGEITLELSPLAAGTITGNLTIAGNTPDSPITVPVQATVIVQEPPSELPKIAFRSEGKSLVIEWSGDGTLQVADGVTGPWTDVIGSSSPTIIENLDANKFYRIKQ